MRPQRASNRTHLRHRQDQMRVLYFCAGSARALHPPGEQEPTPNTGGSAHLQGGGAAEAAHTGVRGVRKVSDTERVQFDYSRSSSDPWFRFYTENKNFVYVLL